MFDQLFRRGAAVRHHLNSPLLQERLEYLRYFADQGYTLTTLRPLAARPAADPESARFSDILGIHRSCSRPGGSEPMGPSSAPAL